MFHILAEPCGMCILTGCTTAAKYAPSVELIRPLQKMFTSHVKADTVLFAASTVDGDVKLGTAPGANTAGLP